MSPMEILTVTLSLFSLVVAGLAAYRAHSLSTLQLRLGSRHNFHKLLLDLNKELIRDPTLWAVYDSHPMAAHCGDDVLQRAKLEAFAYMKFNLYHIVFAYYENQDKESEAERDFHRAWDNTCRDFLNDSALGREILSRPETEAIYGPRFVGYLHRLLGSDKPSCLPSSQADWTTPSKPPA